MVPIIGWGIEPTNSNFSFRFLEGLGLFRVKGVGFLLKGSGKVAVEGLGFAMQGLGLKLYL